MQHIFHSPYWPFVVLALSIAAIILMITKLKFHAFIALMLAAIFAGLISPDLPVVEGQTPLVTAVELPMSEFGIVAGRIAIVIALASIIGMAMLESGAAEKIVSWLLFRLGENNAAIALLASGFILSIPVFFDTVFLLLVPLVISLARKTGRHYVLYIVAVAGGGIITHSLVAPTPGPLIMAETLKIDLGLSIMAGIAAGILPSIAALIFGRRLDRKLHITAYAGQKATEEAIRKPSLFFSFMPILLPVAMISLASVADIAMDPPPAWIGFVGNKNIAMAVGTMLAMLLWARIRKLDRNHLWQSVSKPLEIAGIIILITSAGGAFGAMIKYSGIGNAIQLAMTHFQVNYIWVAWLIAVVMKTAQGSGTVSMITTSAIMAGIIGDGANLPFHPVYIFLATGFGSITISWMNDSAFWVVSKMSGISEKETLRTWTKTGMVVSVSGILQVFFFSEIFPFK